MPLPPELLAVLACPESKAPLLYFAGGEAGDQPAAAFLFCPTSRLRYRIEADGVAAHHATSWSLARDGLSKFKGSPFARIFAAGLWWHIDSTVGRELANLKTTEFLTGYLIEKSLAVDNIFVFLMIFTYFSVPPAYQKRVLMIGIIGAIVLRTIMILAGGWLLQHFGIRMIFTWQAAVIAATIVAFPLVFKAARAAFENVDPQLEDAARTLGLSELAIFFRISLPLAWRGILAGLLLSFARALGEFGATLMVAGSIVGKTQTLSIAVYEAVQAGQDDSANFLVAVTSITCIAVLLSAGRLVPGRVLVRA